MLLQAKGRYRARFSQDAEDIRAARRLRYQAFLEGIDARRGGSGLDGDSFDDTCTHVLIEECASRAVVCCFRLLPLSDGGDIGQSYSAQYYGLSRLTEFSGPMMEMGRFCIRPGHSDPDILRVAWGAMTAFVEENGVELLFGCSSFKGTESSGYMDAFALLKERHLAPRRWLPRVKAPDVFRFAQKLRRRPNVKHAMSAMPPLLRSYLLMGGWVSDHAVIDRRMNTLHVFTGLEIRAIPAARKRLLRAGAG